ncbi:MAG: hypothetical protein JOZ72_12510 [Alphaproteobacteria bacterium]|nr:hypothetical protein [Alphaproteobacteria bacterium]
MEAWHDLFVMIGSSAGALVGLLFIVVSLHFDRLGRQDDVNTRGTMEGARNNTMHLLTVLLEAAAVLTPQPPTWLGAELILLNLFGLRLPLMIIYRYANQHITISQRGGFPTVLIATVIAAYVMGAIGGAATIARLDWALFVVALACLVKVVRTVLTAWMLIFGIRHTAKS